MKKLTVLILLALSLLLASSCTSTEPLPENTATPKPSPTPTPPKVTWTNIGPGGGGNLTSIAFASSSTIYVGCDVGGVYRSLDSGKTWEIINEGLKAYSVQEIAVDPSNPSVIYVGTYDGVYKSEDGGDHWERKKNGFPNVFEWPWGVPIGVIAVDPNDPSTVYAGVGDTDQDRWGEGKIYKSTDAGVIWFVVNKDNTDIDPEAIIYDIVIHPNNSDILYISTDRGFYKSYDGGITWEQKEEGLPHNHVRQIALYPGEADILYITLFSPPNQTPWQGGVYKSTDSGETWVKKTNGLDVKIGSPGDRPYATANYEQIEVDPTNPDIVYVGANYWTGKDGVYKTTNGGNSWKLTVRDDNWERGWRPQGGTQRVETMAMDPFNPSRILWGETGLYETMDGGESWHQLYTNETPPGSDFWQGRGLEITGLYDIEVDPTNSNLVYFAYGDISFFRSEDGGKTFTRSIGGLDLSTVNTFFKIVIDPDDPSVIYAGRGWWHWDSGELVKSVDGGRNWTTIGSPANGLPDARVFDLALDYSSPVESRTLYAASYRDGVFKSTDGGASWEAVNNGIEFDEEIFVKSIAIDPEDPNTLYISLDRDGGLYKTIDSGLNWERLSLDYESIWFVEIDPRDPQTIYASVPFIEGDGGLYRSHDGGNTWELIFVNTFVSGIALDPTNSRVMYVSTKDTYENPKGDGVFRSGDGGETWQPINEGLSHLSIFCIEIDPNNPNIIYIGSEGNGAFKGVIEE